MSADVATIVAASRAAQGLPPKVEDESVLLEAAGRLLAANGASDKRKAAPRT
jgi:hypothetical protein